MIKFSLYLTFIVHYIHSKFSIIFPLHTYCPDTGNDVNRHQGRWEGRNMEVTSTELRWTGRNGGQKRNNSNQGLQCIMPPARRPNTTEFKGGYFFPASRAYYVCSENSIMSGSSIRIIGTVFIRLFPNLRNCQLEYEVFRKLAWILNSLLIKENYENRGGLWTVYRRDNL